MTTGLLAISACAVAGIGACANIYTNRYIKKTFDTKQSLYFALKIDSMMTAVSSLSSFLAILASIADVHFGVAGCFVLTYFSMTGFFLNPFLTFLVSYIRFMKIKHAHLGWVKDQVILLVIFWSVVGLYSAFALYLILAILYDPGKGTAGPYFDCLNSDIKGSALGLTISSIIILLILSLIICLSIGMDLFCLWRLHHEEAIREENKRKHQLDLKVHLQELEQIMVMDPKGDTSKNREVLINAQELLRETSITSSSSTRGIKINLRETSITSSSSTRGIKMNELLDWKMALIIEDKDDRNEAMPPEKADIIAEPIYNDQPEDKVKMVINDLPVRSTLLNTLFLVPYIIIIATLGNISDDFSAEDKSYILGLPFLVLTIGRTWFVATCTFKVNDFNRRKDANVERERNRLQEIKEALEKKRQRQIDIEPQLDGERYDPEDKNPALAWTSGSDLRRQSVTKPIKNLEIEKALTKRMERNQSKATKVLMDEIYHQSGTKVSLEDIKEDVVIEVESV